MRGCDIVAFQLLLSMNEAFIMLLAAHCYGDFLLQSKAMAENKHQRSVLVRHGLIHGIVAYLILQQWIGWQVPVLVFGFHVAIDCVKTCFPTTPRAFALDQLAHLISLAAIGALAPWLGVEIAGMGSVHGWILTGAGFVTCVFGAGYLISLVAQEMMKENPSLPEALKRGLKGGGSRIGKLERALIFLFLVIGNPAGIGFLIAAKSILRFEEAKQQNVSEYVLIGTLWSFGLAIAITWATLQLAEFAS